jgi:hypothetical protein
MFGQSLLSAFGIACTTDTDQLFTAPTSTASLATYELNSNANSIPYNQSVTSIATYQLNNATTSIPNNTYPGTASNITYAAGKFGNAAEFNGTSSYVSINSSTSLQLLGDYAVSFWFKTNALSGTQRLVNKDNANDFSGGWGFSLYSDGTFNWSHNDGSNNQNWTINAGTISANTWYNICAVYSDSNNLRTFYLNGSSVGTIATNTNVAASTDNLFFGTYGASSPAGQYFNGSLDQVRIFNSVLPQAAVTALYNETTTTAQYDYVSYPVSYNGTPTNITYAAGKFGNAAVFNGSTSNIDTNLSLNSLTDYTISLWLNPTGGAFFGGTINSSAKNGFYFQYSPNVLYWVEVNASAVVSNLTITGAINTGSWNHIVFVRSGGTNYIYVNNGTPVSVSNGSYTHATDFTLGKAGAFTTSPIIGSIDQVRIFNTALPQSAITALYNETTTTAQSNNIDYQLANPNSIAYYKMSDATDQLGNYNGTASNVNFNTEGKFGFAGALSSSNNSYINTNFVSTLSSASYSFWIKVPSSQSTNSTRLLSSITANPLKAGQWSFIYNGSGTVSFQLITNGGSVTNFSNVSFSLDTWEHFVFTYDNSNTTGKVYLNGSLATSSSIGNVTETDNTSPLYFGFYPRGSTYDSDSTYDQVRIYDSALSAANVTALYNEIECPAVAVTNAFNTVLYTGDDTNTSYTRNVTGVGFKPDFIWIKSRDTSAYEHALFDSVRGAGASKILSSDTTGAEGWTSAGPMSAFITDGFSIQPRSPWNSNNLINKNGDDFVSWNWKAPLANLSTGFNGSSSYISTSLSSSSINAMSFWLYFESGTTQYTPFGTDVGSGAGDIVTELGTNGSFSMTIQNKVYSAGAGALGSTGWKHIAYSSNQELYINGVLHTGGTTATTSNPSANLLMGGWNITIPSWGAFNSKIDQLRVYNTALTAGDVATLYAEPAASNNTLNYPAGAGCIAAYPLQTDAVDLSGNYNGASSNVTFGQPGYLTENTEGTIPSTVAANVDAGFSIVKWKGSGASGQSIGHGLNSEPELILQKRTNIAGDWECYHKDLGATKKILLNSTAAATTSSAFGNTAPTSTVSYAGAYTNELVNYYFHSVDGYSKIGSYVGTGTAGNFIYTGFQPRFLLTKRSSAAGGGWNIFDSTRGTDKRLYPNLSNAEGTDSPEIVTFNSNGFTFNTADSWNNGSYTYIYLAIA